MKAKDRSRTKLEQLADIYRRTHEALPDIERQFGMGSFEYAALDARETAAKSDLLAWAVSSRRSR